MEHSTLQEVVTTTTMPAVQTGWIDTLKDKLHVQSLVDDFNLSAGKIGEVAAWVAIGFFSGFLFKKYFRYAILAVVVTLLTMKGLEYFEIATVDWTKFQQLFGIQATDTMDSFFKFYGDWIQQNISVVLSCSIGFLIGFKLG